MDDMCFGRSSTHISSKDSEVGHGWHLVIARCEVNKCTVSNFHLEFNDTLMTLLFSLKAKLAVSDILIYSHAISPIEWPSLTSIMITRLTLSLRSGLHTDGTALPYGWPTDMLETNEEENKLQLPTLATVSDAAVFSGSETPTNSK